MGKRVTPEERGRRLVGKVHVRELASHGKCQLCKRKVSRGEKSLRYTELVFGRKQEMGICMDCAVKVWQAAEEVVGLVSAEVQEYIANKSQEPPTTSLVVTQPVSPVPQDVAVLPPETIEEKLAGMRKNRESLMQEMFPGGTNNSERNSLTHR